MHALIKRLDRLCHPFPGTHALGLAASAVALVLGLAWPTEGPATVNQNAVTHSALPLNTITSEPSQSKPPEPAFRVAQETVKSGDTLSSLFQRQALTAQDLIRVTANEGKKRPLSLLKVGQSVEFRYADDVLVELAVVQTPFHHTVAVSDESGQWTIEERHREPEVYIEHASGVIDSSLFLAGAKAGLPDNLIMEMANIYGNVIDFVYEIRQGDRFIVTFEKRYLDGEFIEYGNILAAEFINNKESFFAIRYTDSEGDTGYFDGQGVSLRKAFLRAPLNFRRISSNFNLARKHPVLGITRAHRGTDYAASTGTPVYAAGDGKVVFRGKKGWYGNLVTIRHGNGIETRYAHLSKFGRYGVGSRVKQGQIIGYVGATGLVTGPHLHYEFLVNGVHRNPRTILDKLPKAKTLPATEMARFEQVAEPLIASIEAQKNNAELALQTTSR